MTIKITKQLATVEDLAIGTGTVVQERNGVPLTLTKIDLITASKLASENAGEGAALVSMQGGSSVENAVSTNASNIATNAEAILDRVIRVTSIAEMEAYSAPVGYVFSLNAGGRSGTFDVVAGDFSSELAADTLNGVYIGLADNVTATTKVAKRRYNGAVVPQWFGAIGDGSADDTTALSVLLDILILQGSGRVYAPAGVYKLTAPISKTLSGIQSLAIQGDGADLTEFRFIGASDGFTFTAADGNWWQNVSPGNGFYFSNFSVTTDNTESGTGFTVNGGSVSGRPPRKTEFNNVTFRGNDGFTDTWSVHLRLVDTASVFLNSCKWMIGGPGSDAAIGVEIEGTVGSDPSGFYFNHCEAFYGAIWIATGRNVEGIYLTNCSHVAGVKALTWIATAESGLHVMGGHFNNTETNFLLDGVFDFEILGALLYSNGHGAADFTSISVQNGGGGTITGNVFTLDKTGVERGILIDESPGDSRYGICISGNTFSNIEGDAVTLGSNSQHVTVCDNSYANVNTDVGNIGTNNRVIRRQYAASTVITLVGGSGIESVNIALPSGAFTSKPSVVFFNSTDTGIVGFYDFDNASNSATNAVITIRDINNTNISAVEQRFSLIAFE